LGSETITFSALTRELAEHVMQIVEMLEDFDADDGAVGSLREGQRLARIEVHRHVGRAHDVDAGVANALENAAQRSVEAAHVEHRIAQVRGEAARHEGAALVPLAESGDLGGEPIGRGGHGLRKALFVWSRILLRAV
jgi:hypothetical protein